MDRASRQCLRARVSICHNQIKVFKDTLNKTKDQLSCLVAEETSTLSKFLHQRSQSVKTTITSRHARKFKNLDDDAKNVDQFSSSINKDNWVVNLSSKPLSQTERSFLEKGPKFAPTPAMNPFKEIVCEIEAAVANLPDVIEDSIRTTAASICLLKVTSLNLRKH